MENYEDMDDEIVQMEQNSEESKKSDIENEEDEISFADLGLDENTLAAVERKGFKVPSPIQVLAIPRLLNGDANIIARARTGTGKTAAFGLPIIQKVSSQPKGTVRALVLEPTRELAIQTCNEMQSFTEGKGPSTCVLYGGASYSIQIKELRRGCEIVVGTPGRIQDHLERGTLDISKIDYFILDEGDQMLDMGFIDDIEAIFAKANPNSRILLFSATMPAPILKIAQKFMGDYEIVEEEGVVDEPLLIDQKVWIVRESEKLEALVRLIDISPDFYGVVFTQTKSDADYVSRSLDEKGYEVAALHGDIAQSQREKILSRFRIKKTRILVATDVAARGIDISGLTHVVNYSLPFDGATYVHRIGRTGRAGSQGTAVTFVTPSETRKLGYLRRAVEKASKGEMKEETVPDVEKVISAKQARLFSELKEKIGLSETDENKADARAEASLEQNDVNDQLSEKSEDSENINAKSAADSCELSSEDNEPIIEEKHYDLKKVPQIYEKMAEELCSMQEPEKILASVLSVMYGNSLDRSRYGKLSARADSSNQLRIYVQLGRRDGYSAKDLADYFSQMLHIPGRMVDRIDISSNFSLVSLPKEAAKKALALAQSNRSIPHMHIDIKENDSSRSRRGGGRRDFGGRGRGFGGESDSRRRDFGRRDGFERHEGRKRDSFKQRSSRPNVHTPTERAGSAGLYKQKKSRAERF